MDTKRKIKIPLDKKIIEDVWNIEVQDPIDLALSGDYFAEITQEELEAISLEQQSRYTGDSS